jgi:RNA polymerase sigma-70 factor (ECF subfamily)
MPRNFNNPKAASRACDSVRRVTIPRNAGEAPPDDGELLVGLRAGDDAAYERMVRSYMPRMLSVARRFLRSEEDARDAVQDAFLSAFRSIDRFEGNARISTWLHRIVVNASLMKLRTRRRKPERSIEELMPGFLEDGHLEQPPSEWAKLPEDQAAQRQLRELLLERIHELPEGYRTVLMLRDIEELDTEETAKALELTPGAVKTRLHRARIALRGLLEPHLRRASP